MRRRGRICLASVIYHKHCINTSSRSNQQQATSVVVTDEQARKNSSGIGCRRGGGLCIAVGGTLRLRLPAMECIRGPNVNGGSPHADSDLPSHVSKHPSHTLLRSS